MSPPEAGPLVGHKYEIKRRLGKGAYGIVWKATDRSTGETVAVKKVFDAFRNRTDAQRTFREILFLQEFGEHPNIIKLLDVIPAENDKDIYLIFESMETDLHAVIKKGNVLKDIHKCYILYQLLKATKFIHSGNVIHRDQKPSNVLLDTECRVKLCDFGLARALCQPGHPEPGPALTEYVATRWYRAPELLLGCHRYTKGVDMWSIGCILAEMLLGKPLFPGTSTVDQMEQILRVIPAPSPEDILALQSDYKASVINQMSSRQQGRLEELFPPSTPAQALDLLRKLLVFHPERRISAEQALQHPYVGRFHRPSREPSLGAPLQLPLGAELQLSVPEYRQKLQQMILGKKFRRSFPKEQKEHPGLSQPELSSVPEPTGKGQQEPTSPVLNPSHVPAGATAGATAGPPAQPPGPRQGKDLGRAECQRAQSSVTMYNPITHTTVQRNANPGVGIRNFLARPQQPRISSTGKLGRQTTWATTLGVPPLSGQNLCSNSRSSQGHSRAAPALPKPSRKMFQVSANVGAAGDPRASMGSYSQAYGTISQSALQSLPIAKGSPKPGK